MAKKKINADEAMRLQDDFENIVVPWGRKNKLSLHQAFEKSRSNDIEKYKILSDLWSTYFGKEYLRSAFSGGKLKGD